MCFGKGSEQHSILIKLCRSGDPEGEGLKLSTAVALKPVGRTAISSSVMAGLDPPAGPKPLRRGEGPAIHVVLRSMKKDVDARDKPAHDE